MPLSVQELERRIQKDPASIAFAQLAEEYRRAGRYEDAVRVARAGLARHPGYLSARVTLGRVLVELDQLDAAKTELETVLKSAPENLAAIRARAEIHQRRGDTPEPPPIPAPPSPLPKAPEPVTEWPVPAPEPVPETVVPDALSPPLDVLPEVREPEHALDLDLQEFNTALEALTLDLPGPEPAAPPEEFDLASFRMDDGSAPRAPETWSLDNLDPAPAPPSDALKPVATEPSDPALVALEQWLGALVADRADRKRR